MLNINKVNQQKCKCSKIIIIQLCAKCCTYTQYLLHTYNPVLVFLLGAVDLYSPTSLLHTPWMLKTVTEGAIIYSVYTLFIQTVSIMSSYYKHSFELCHHYMTSMIADGACEVEFHVLWHIILI